MLFTVDELLQEAALPPMMGKQLKTAKAKAAGKTVEEYAERISAKWHNTVASIMMVAADCYSAREEFKRSPSERHDLIERLPFGDSMFSKLASIGEDERLTKNQKLLPASISTIDLIRKLSDEQFEAAKAEKVLKPNVTRDEIEEWTRSKTDKPARTKASEPELPLALYCIYPEQLLDREQHAKVWSAVVEVAESQGLKAEYFTGESLITQLKAFFTKKPQAI